MDHGGAASTAAQTDATMISEPAPELVLPSERELELELMVRDRDEQLATLSNQVRSLRRRIPSEAGSQPPSNSPISLPTSVVSAIAPLVAKRPTAGPSKTTTVTSALTQRLSALQEENDELYSLLKRGTVSKLHEEVTELRTLTRKLEEALKESHSIISSLKNELEQAYFTIEARSRQNKRQRSVSRSRSREPVNHYRQQPQSLPPKPLPTGPRALKKPRVSHEPPSGSRQHNGESVKVEPPGEDFSAWEDSNLSPITKQEDSYDSRWDDSYEQKPALSKSRSPAPERGRGRTPTVSQGAPNYPDRAKRGYSLSPDPEPTPVVVRRRSPTPRQSPGRRATPSPRPPSSLDDRSPVTSRRSATPGRRSRSPSRLRADYRTSHHSHPNDRRDRDRDRGQDYRSPAPSSSSRGYSNRDREKDRDKGRGKRSYGNHGSKPTTRPGNGSTVHSGTGSRHSGSGGVTLASRIR